MSEWQPTETAPRDGTRVDLWIYLNRPIFECAWVNGKWTDPKGDCEYFLPRAEETQMPIWYWRPHFKDLIGPPQKQWRDR